MTEQPLIGIAPDGSIAFAPDEPASPMTPLERAIAAVNNTAVVKDMTGDQHGVLSDESFPVVVNPGEVARAVLQAFREPSEGLLHALLEALDDRDFRTAWSTTGLTEEEAGHLWQAMIDAALEEG